MCPTLTGLQSLSYKSNFNCTVLWFFISFTLYEHCPKYCLSWLSTVPLVFGWILYVKYLFLITSDFWTPCAKEQRQETRGTCWGLPRSSICSKVDASEEGTVMPEVQTGIKSEELWHHPKDFHQKTESHGRCLSRKVVWTGTCFSKIIFGCI